MSASVAVIILTLYHKMNWYQDIVDDEEEADLMFSPALLARRASESWIIAPPVEVWLLNSLVKI